MLRHAQEAIQVLLKRKADQESEEKRQREEAEAICQKYLLAEMYHPEAAEKLADAATLLGWNTGDLGFEAALTEGLPRTFKDLDTLEYRYREAVEDRERTEQYWKNQHVPMGINVNM
jgi:hypothetical protein